MRLEQNQALLITSNKLPKTLAPFQEVVLMHIWQDPSNGRALVEVLNCHGHRQEFTSMELVEAHMRAMHIMEVRKGMEAFAFGEKPDSTWSEAKRLGYAIVDERSSTRLRRTELEVSSCITANY